MLGKLLKYEMKASARTLLPLYIGTLVVALICGIQTGMVCRNMNEYSFFWFDDPLKSNNLAMGFLFLLFFALCVAIMVLTAMIVVQRFNKNLIGDEGYLWFTLPVSHTKLLTSKIISGLLWVLIGTVVMVLASVIIVLPAMVYLGDVNWAGLWRARLYLFNSWSEYLPDIIATGIAGILGIIGFILTVYVSIMIAQMEQLNKHRVAVSVVLFFVINWFFNFVETMVLNFVGIDMYTYVMYTGHWYGNMMWGDIAFTLLQCVLCFAGVIWLMKKKLNL